MQLRDAFAQSLRDLRLTKELTQEDFDQVSSRTYISMLERAERSPTLDKIEELASVLKIHPLTLLTLTYMKVAGQRDARTLQERVASELGQVKKGARSRAK